MSSIKSLVLFFLLVTFFSAIITPVFATTTQQQSPVFAAEQMPTWLAEAGAVTVADAELELVQGEVIITWTAIMAGLSLATMAYLYYKFVTGKPFVGIEQAAWDFYH